MEFMAEITQGVQSLSTVVKAIKALTDKARQQGEDSELIREINAAIIEMQEVVISVTQTAAMVQVNESKLSRRIAELEQEISRLNDWNDEANRYELMNTGDTGQFGYKIAYGVKTESTREGEPKHFLCPNCFENRVRSVLQNMRVFGLVCNRCSSGSGKSPV